MKIGIYLKVVLCEYLKVLLARPSHLHFDNTYEYDEDTVYVGERL